MTMAEVDESSYTFNLAASKTNEFGTATRSTNHHNEISKDRRTLIFLTEMKRPILD